MQELKGILYMGYLRATFTLSYEDSFMLSNGDSRRIVLWLWCQCQDDGVHQEISNGWINISNTSPLAPLTLVVSITLAPIASLRMLWRPPVSGLFSDKLGESIGVVWPTMLLQALIENCSFPQAKLINMLWLCSSTSTFNLYTWRAWFG